MNRLTPVMMMSASQLPDSAESILTPCAWAVRLLMETNNTVVMATYIIIIFVKVRFIITPL